MLCNAFSEKSCLFKKLSRIGIDPGAENAAHAVDNAVGAVETPVVFKVERGIDPAIAYNKGAIPCFAVNIVSPDYEVVASNGVRGYNVIPASVETYGCGPCSSAVLTARKIQKLLISYRIGMECPARKISALINCT